MSDLAKFKELPALKAEQGHFLQDLLARLPQQVGVYLHKDCEQRILYVGKAKNLRSRVRSYFQASAKLGVRIQAMVNQVRDIEVICTASETEALMLEANLIKKHRPHYNIHFKDDKSYPFFKLTVGEPYARLYLTREKRESDAEYYGPFASVSDARTILRILQRHFRLRTSKMYLDGSKTYRPCINYQLKRCLAPCRGDVPLEQYQKVVQKVRLFFRGCDKQLLARLKQEMETHAQAQQYLEAARARDALAAIKRLLEKQRVVLPNQATDVDMFGLARQAGMAGIQVMFVRGGRLLGSDFQLLETGSSCSDEKILEAFLSRFYSRAYIIPPKQIWVPNLFDKAPLIQQWLLKSNAQAVKILTPKRGKSAALFQLAQENAARQIKNRLSGYLSSEKLTQAVQHTLKLKNMPHHIEACDISHLQGKSSVAAIVCWQDTQPFTSLYRYYHIHKHQPAPVEQIPNDTAAIYEAISRHAKKKLEQNLPWPHLLLIDGGKAQANAALKALKDLNIDHSKIDICALAKGRSLKQKASQLRSSPQLSQLSPQLSPKLLQTEYIVFPKRKDPLFLPARNPTLLLLQRIRDDAHRSALSSHRKLRTRNLLSSSLLQIPGIGAKRANHLLKTLGSLKQIQAASLAQLEQASGINPKLAASIYRFFH